MSTVKVKICGISTLETLEAACRAGADYVGFVFFERSPRHVSYDQARTLSRATPKGVIKVALTVNADDTVLTQIMASLDPDMLQLHGQESPERVAEIKEKFGRPVLKAISIASRQDFDAMTPFCGIADMFLFDAKVPADMENALPGGNGISFDWRLLDNAAIKGDFMLSGGLDPDNVAQAIELTKAPIIDVSSGVETSPGVKNCELISRFITAAKG